MVSSMAAVQQVEYCAESGGIKYWKVFELFLEIPKVKTVIDKL